MHGLTVVMRSIALFVILDANMPASADPWNECPRATSEQLMAAGTICWNNGQKVIVPKAAFGSGWHMTDEGKVQSRNQKVLDIRLCADGTFATEVIFRYGRKQDVTSMACLGR
jgi:hypothetical protein